MCKENIVQNFYFYFHREFQAKSIAKRWQNIYLAMIANLFVATSFEESNFRKWASSIYNNLASSIYNNLASSIYNLPVVNHYFEFIMSKERNYTDTKNNCWLLQVIKFYNDLLLLRSFNHTRSYFWYSPHATIFYSEFSY